MAAILANDDLLEMRVICYYGSQIAVNVYHYRTTNLTVVSGDVTTADMAQQMSGVLQVPYINLMPTTARFFGCGVRRLTPTLTLEDGWAGDEAGGTESATVLPSQTCGLVTLLTGLGGRSQRGRKYFGFPAHTFMTAASLADATYRGRMADVIDLYLAGGTIVGVDGTTIDLVAVLKHLNNTHNDVTSYITRSQWGTQKSRGSYGRPNTLPSWPV